jgi:hypothetical protein
VRCLFFAGWILLNVDRKVDICDTFDVLPRGGYDEVHPHRGEIVLRRYLDGGRRWLALALAIAISGAERLRIDEGRLQDADHNILAGTPSWFVPTPATIS